MKQAKDQASLSGFISEDIQFVYKALGDNCGPFRLFTPREL